MEMAEGMLEEEELAADIDRGARPQRRAKDKKSWKQKVNLQRDLVRADMEAGRVRSLDEMVDRLGCHKSTARRLRDRQFFLRHIPGYEYNNQRPPEVAQNIIGLMTSDEGRYFSTSSVKQRMPEVSKKFVARTLRQNGLRYRRIRHTRPPRHFDQAEVCRVLSTALPAFDRADESLLFLDEVIFPLNHTPTHCWRHKDDTGDGYKERTQCKTQLTCIALCSKTRVIAVQLHTEEMQAQAIIHFLTEVLQRHRTTDKVVVLLDNAKYHSAQLVRESNVGPYLLFSVPRCWELNLIEVLFSKAKEKWRRRISVRCAEEEASQVVKVFRECQVAADFAGYRRQYLRNALIVLKL
jgi:transposase